MELSLEEIEAQAVEMLPERAVMSITGSSMSTTSVPAMPDDLSNSGPVPWSRFAEFNPFSQIV